MIRYANGGGSFQGVVSKLQRVGRSDSWSEKEGFCTLDSGGGVQECRELCWLVGGHHANSGEEEACEGNLREDMVLQVGEVRDLFQEEKTLVGCSFFRMRGESTLRQRWTIVVHVALWSDSALEASCLFLRIVMSFVCSWGFSDVGLALSMTFCFVPGVCDFWVWYLGGDFCS